MYEKITLENGVRIVYEHMPHVRSACVGIWVGTGSRNEKSTQSGAAHFIEHMLFKGTKTRTAAQLAGEMDAIGGQINAYTTRESTCYYARVLDIHLDKAVELLGDMFFSSNFDPADIDNERGVINEEIDMYDDEPEDMVAERLIFRSFKGQLGRPVLGTPASLKKLGAEQLREFMDENYIAPRVVISLSGSFDMTHLAQIRQLFSAMPERKSRKTRACEYTPSFTLKRKSTEQNHLCLGFRGLPSGDERRFTMQILSSVLGSGMSSRLFQTVREQHGLCYSVYSFNASFKDTGLFGIATALSAETEGRAIELILGELDKFRSGGVTAEELSRAREQSKAGVLMSLESTSSRMNRLGFGELVMGRSLSADELITRYDAVTEDDVLALAQDVLKSEMMSFSAVGRVASPERYRQLLNISK